MVQPIPHPFSDQFKATSQGKVRVLLGIIPESLFKRRSLSHTGLPCCVWYQQARFEQWKILSFSSALSLFSVSCSCVLFFLVSFPNQEPSETETLLETILPASWCAPLPTVLERLSPAQRGETVSEVCSLPGHSACPSH